MIIITIKTPIRTKGIIFKRAFKYLRGRHGIKESIMSCLVIIKINLFYNNPIFFLTSRTVSRAILRARSAPSRITSSTYFLSREILARRS